MTRATLLSPGSGSSRDRNVSHVTKDSWRLSQKLLKGVSIWVERSVWLRSSNNQIGQATRFLSFSHEYSRVRNKTRPFPGYVSCGCFRRTRCLLVRPCTHESLTAASTFSFSSRENARLSYKIPPDSLVLQGRAVSPQFILQLPSGSDSEALPVPSSMFLHFTSVAFTCRLPGPTLR